MHITKYRLTLGALAVILISALFSFGQTTDESVILLPGQTIEREMIGAVTHRYKFDLKKDEFFQVRVGQKGVDGTLKLTDTIGRGLATMDSTSDMMTVFYQIRREKTEFFQSRNFKTGAIKIAQRQIQSKRKRSPARRGISRNVNEFFAGIQNG